MGSDWRIEAKRSLLRREPWFEVFQETIRLPGGQLVDDFYTIASPEYSVVACFDEDDNVLAERLYRHGAHAMTWSIPAGYVEPGETPEAAARRELREETGFEAASWEMLGRFVVDGNRGSGWANLFMAGELTRVAAPNNEDLVTTELKWIPYEQMIQFLAKGGIVELATAAALAMVAVNRR
jgi:ADP-ribose pyrophosphatase